MALEIVSGTTYQSTATTVQKPEYRTSGVTASETGADMMVVDLPGTSKASGGSQTQNEQDKGQKDGMASDKHIKDAISKANTKIKRTSCEFSYDEDTKRVSIKVVDDVTKEVIKEIPPEDTLKMIEKMYELAGIIFDEKR